jgi:hypothetical protein
MAKIRLNLNSLSISEKIAKALQIVTRMTGNATFATPSPALPTITTAANELKTASDDVQEVRQLAKEKTSIQNQKEDVLDQLLTQLAGYVESVAGDDEQLILSAGMDVRTPGVVSTSPPAPPQGVIATSGDHDGEIDLSWDPVTAAKSYVIEQSTDPAAANSWTHSGVSARSSFTAQRLNSGTRYWLRVAAINNNGQSGWSDSAMKIAP